MRLSLRELSELKGVLQCEVLFTQPQFVQLDRLHDSSSLREQVPHHVMYSFKGTLTLESGSRPIPLDNEQLLLQVLC